MTWVIKAEHTGAFPGNPSFAWIKRKFYIFMHRHPAPSELEHSLVGILVSWGGTPILLAPPQTKMGFSSGPMKCLKVFFIAKLSPNSNSAGLS